MNEIIHTLLSLYDDESFLQSEIISWASPILSFGDISNSRIATIGLNPSNREFVDEKGNELLGVNKRFETLNSLKITKWNKIRETHLLKIEESFNNYFFNNPYDTWFKKLDFLISGSGYSYYFPFGNACHLDLIPFATITKWGELDNWHKRWLSEISMDALGLILNRSRIELVVLNGQSVVDGLINISDASLQKRHLPSISLNRAEGKNISGYGYVGIVNKIGNVALSRTIKVIGYNHNIQSSYGVSKDVHLALRKWVTQKTNALL